jgi:hypothetical protein
VEGANERLRAAGLRIVVERFPEADPGHDGYGVRDVDLGAALLAAPPGRAPGPRDGHGE